LEERPNRLLKRYVSSSSALILKFPRKLNGTRQAFIISSAVKPFNPKVYTRHIVVINPHKRILMVFQAEQRLRMLIGLLTGNYPRRPPFGLRRKNGWRTNHSARPTGSYQKLARQGQQMTLSGITSVTTF
jgi:hypothetical protein